MGKENKGKVLSINFTKVEFKNDQLDKNYFLYLFNVFKDVKRQKEKEMQGTGVIQKIPLKALGNIKIPLLPIVEQQKIGKFISKLYALQSELSQFSRTLEEFSYSLLEGQSKMEIKMKNKSELAFEQEVVDYLTHMVVSNSGNIVQKLRRLSNFGKILKLLLNVITKPVLNVPCQSLNLTK
ncbi:hypothetical protein ICE98_00526 [Lactococcus lactis]|nr:hypothetical protein [Lactococcus lactis]